MSFEEIDEAIRAGQVARARERIEALAREEISREDRTRFASLARRAGLYGIALRVLHPLVRPTEASPTSATEAERLEYAASLTYVGAPAEALALLKSLDGSEQPETWLYGAFALFAQWEYEPAVPLLKKYLKHPAVSGYAALIGKINLGAALVEQRRFFDADPLLRKTVKEAALQGAVLLQGNCLELSAQSYIRQERWEEAEGSLARAREILVDTDTLYALFVRKWEAVLRLRRGDVGAIGDLRAVRAEALERRHWETVRDCDRHEALATKSEALLLRLWFGTPFAGFRRSLLEEADWFPEARLPTEYHYQVEGTGGPLLDPGAEPGTVLHRLYVALTGDFYRPLRVATLFCEMFPGEAFNPVTAPARVHEAVRRLREWLAARETPLEISEHKGEYRLSAAAPCRLRIHGEMPTTSDESRLKRLGETYGQGRFTAKDAAKLLGVDRRTVARLMLKALAQGKARAEGKGKATGYRILPEHGGPSRRSP